MYGLIDVPTFTKIQRTRFPKNLCSSLVKQHLSSVGENTWDDNLVGVDRSNWQIYKGYEDDPSFLELASHCQLYAETVHNKFPEDELNVDWVSAWIMNGKDGGIVQPHVHGKHWGELSFSLYLSLPKEKTSISFMSVDVNNDVFHREIIVEEGDMLVFPGNLIHFSKDISADRVVMSGNVVVNYIPKRAMENEV